MDNDEYNADVRSLEGDNQPAEQTDVPPHDAEKQDEQSAEELAAGVELNPVELDGAPREELIPESPPGAEENDGEPEKPDFGEYDEEASVEHTEDHADFDAGSDDDAASEPPR